MICFILKLVVLYGKPYQVSERGAILLSKKSGLKTVQKPAAKLDVIGPWSEVKHHIVKKYSKAYTTIISKQKFYTAYIDAFSGAGVSISKKTGEHVQGSPLNALQVTPPFNHYYFVDVDGSKIALLRELVGNRPDVTIEEGDCNVVLLERVFPELKWEEYKRGLCFLDPYGLHLMWDVLAQAGKMRSIEVFLNFPLYDMKLNVLWKKDPQGIGQKQLERMDKFWGDRSWFNEAFDSTGDLFGHLEKLPTAHIQIVRAFRERLKSVAGFRHVLEPIPMFNEQGGLLYYLFFASNNPVGNKIARDILNSFKGKRA